ncbi:PspC domain-containing protein [Sphingomicrobium arenosum]|uniref:PspC domain-containing protein n=1 Tax=Sphingomicrobium arenosum TaxID=2233861 RepID=UPI00223F1030|nr:PspC domain-containing protein [Sphingomicrobium arenosum]
MMNGNIFLRNDTIFGICQALGEDFGFNPNILRVALILPLFWFPVEVAITYVGLGLVVLASRLLFKDRSPATVAADGKSALPRAGQPANSDLAISDAA